MNTLLYSMGEKADDILQSFNLSEEELKKYDTVVAKFQNHFISRRNVIFERAKFNSRKQEGGENVDSFITALYGLAEHCGFGSLHDELIRDRIVVGIRDIALSEKMQMDPKLNLEKAVNYVRQSEAVKKQQETVRGTPTSNFTPIDEAINVVNKARSQYKATSRSHRTSDRAKKTQQSTFRAKNFTRNAIDAENHPCTLSSNVQLGKQSVTTAPRRDILNLCVDPKIQLEIFQMTKKM